MIDSNNNELASASTHFQSLEVEESVDKSKLLQSDVPAGQTVSRYLFFETESKDIRKLKVACSTKNKTNNKSSIAGGDVFFEYYYINL